MFPSSVPTPTPPVRRRGGQPGNSNALTHGLYSGRAGSVPAHLHRTQVQVSTAPVTRVTGESRSDDQSHRGMLTLSRVPQTGQCPAFQVSLVSSINRHPRHARIRKTIRAVVRK
jgi:hypothetical protein